MSINRYACRRDANEGPIIAAARKLGVKAWPLDEPCDWLVLIGGHWYPAEIKAAKGKLTANQEEFQELAKEGRGEILLWRSESEMISDVQRLRVK